MKKKSIKSLKLNKKSITDLNSPNGGAQAIDTHFGCNNTGCVGPPRNTCGIINCELEQVKY